MIRILIAAVSPMARAGLEALLRASPNLEITAAGEDADVVIADWDRGADDLLPDLLDLAPAAAVILLAGAAQQVWTADALRAGVRGVLPRDASPNQIVAAVEAVAAGLIVLPSEGGRERAGRSPAHAPLRNAEPARIGGLGPQWPKARVTS